MENILLVDNKGYFDKHGIVTIKSEDDIPNNRSAILFHGSHSGSMNNFDPELWNKLLRRIQDYSEHKYVIIIGKTDSHFTADIIDGKTSYYHSSLGEFELSENIIKIYMNNIEDDNSVLSFLPMGRDFRSVASFRLSDIDNENRPILCYCNFSVNTCPAREGIYNDLKKKSFITFEHMGNWMSYNISRDHFYTQLSNSKFTVCPRGNALDTFRFYDALYSGSIPIVVKTGYHQNFNDLPILFLERDEDYGTLTKEYLEEQYKAIKQKKHKYYRQLDFNWWMTQIREALLTG
jgi:uncharacterized protein (DUF2164 family)